MSQPPQQCRTATQKRWYEISWSMVTLALEFMPRIKAIMQEPHFVTINSFCILFDLRQSFVGRRSAVIAGIVHSAPAHDKNGRLDNEMDCKKNAARGHFHFFCVCG